MKADFESSWKERLIMKIYRLVLIDYMAIRKLNWTFLITKCAYAIEQKKMISLKIKM